ncbi:TPA: 50S ribosomal protein L23 [Candidatus Micrarchaeota archaeon]|nr:50S ribosomal protein L23 [Candidatus Micrarchaeota archaeon]HIH29836.1 50S ribosomal protein L23 [Candidatus Micrarchaeota archaeon]
MTSILYPVTNEKAIGLIEFQNTLTFVVETKSTKPMIKKDVEELFEVKVAEVNTLITPSGKKRAYVRLKEGFKADDVAAKLKIV